MSGTVMEALRETLARSREKLAADRAADATSANTPEPQVKVASDSSQGEVWEKVASACEFLADNLPSIVDDRDPQTKLAELRKLAAEMSDESDGPHQTKKSPDAVPMSPPQDAGVSPGAPGSAMASEPAMTGGTSLDAGKSGSGQDTPPQTTSPSEGSHPSDAKTALPTNMNDRPGGSESAPEKNASDAEVGQRKLRIIEKLAAQGKITAGNAVEMTKEALMPGLLGAAAGGIGAPEGHETQGMGMGAVEELKGIGKGALTGAALGGVAGGAAGGMSGGVRGVLPGAMAGAGLGALPGGGIGGLMGVARGYDKAKMLGKEAADPSSPQPSIGGHGTPALQTAGVPASHSQGTEAGQGTPPGPADSKRSYVQSHGSAINATKKDLKHPQVSGEMAKYLDQPAMSVSNDSVLQTQLDNTSAAGVKIAAAQTLQNWANQSPENKRKLAAAINFIKVAGEDEGEDKSEDKSEDKGEEKKAPPKKEEGGSESKSEGGPPPAQESAPPPAAPPAAPPAEAAPPMAEPPVAAAPEAPPAPPTPMPGEEAGMPPMGGDEGGISDAALAAAASGVMPEELMAAMEMLAASAGAGAPGMEG